MATPKGRKPVGRPRQEPEPGERVQLSFRVTPDLKRMLDEAADASGRSQSQEAEVRLERSFDRSDLLSEVLTLAFPARTAGLLLAMGVAMQGAAQTTLMLKGRHLHEDWTSDPDAYFQAFAAVHLLEEVGRPQGDFSNVKGGVGNSYAHTLIHDVSRAAGEGTSILDEPTTPHIDTLRRLLGPMTTRMTEQLAEWDKSMDEHRKKRKADEQHDRSYEKMREAAMASAAAEGRLATRPDRSLAILAKHTVEFIVSSNKPSSPQDFVALLEKLISFLADHITSAAALQKKAS